jgi:hypothetical protein
LGGTGTEIYPISETKVGFVPHILQPPLLLLLPLHTTKQAARMRQKRAKTYKRVMALYTQTFGFRTPFQILGTFNKILRGLVRRETVETQCNRGYCREHMTESE